MNDQHTFSIWVQNEPGVLTKIAQMFYRRGYNIETITVGKTHEPDISKIIISVPVDERDIEYLRRQIDNLVDVRETRMLDRPNSIMTEVCLIRIGYKNQQERMQIMTDAQPYHPRIRDVDDSSVTLEVARRPVLIDDFVTMMSRHHILDVSRTGMTAIGRLLKPGPDRSDLNEPRDARASTKE